jgi:dTMP kinase
MSKFYVIEGGEGVGKSTQINLLQEYFEKNNIPSIKTKEPGGSYIAEKIGQLILSQAADIDELTTFYLFQASRREHLINTIIPNLKQGNIVICDRYYDSTDVYQNKIPVEFRNRCKLETLKVDNYYDSYSVPNVVFLLDLDAKKALERVKNRVKLNNYYDNVSLEIFEERRRLYLEIAKKNPRIYVINADREKNEIHEEIIQIIKDKLK